MFIRYRYAIARYAIAASIFVASLIAFTNAFAQTGEIQSRIDARGAEIAALEKEIAGYQSELSELSKRGSSLSKTLSELSITQKKLAASVKLTQDRIAAKTLEIQSLSKKIGSAESDIEDSKLSVSESLRLMNEIGDESLPSIVLSHVSISEAWDSVEQLSALEGRVYERIHELAATKKSPETNKTATERAKSELQKLDRQLSDERKVVLETTREQEKLLRETKNSEAAYERLLEDKLALKLEFEREVLRLESELKLNIDLSKLPQAGSGVLSWPVDRVAITQRFGNTAFAAANPQLYSGIGHNGIDFGVSIGTPIKASLSGTVIGSGNTDLIPGCYSFGKWVMVKHMNGLSTLYAHLSLQTAPVGANVVTGDIIGYSGNTGYSTGPHLHFGLYASSGVELKRFTNSRSCNGAIVPIAALNAYLNPLSYLPAP